MSVCKRVFSKNYSLPSTSALAFSRAAITLSHQASNFGSSHHGVRLVPNQSSREHLPSAVPPVQQIQLILFHFLYFTVLSSVWQSFFAFSGLSEYQFMTEY